MANKRINILPLSFEELEYVLGVPQGHHIETITYSPERRLVNLFISGDSMTEVHPGTEIPWVRLNILLQRWSGRRTKHTENPIAGA